MKPNLKEHLRFERLLTELFASFVNVTESNIDERFNKALERIGRILLLDGCLLALFHKTNNVIEVTHGWITEGIDQGILLTTEKQIPWLAAQLRNMEGFEFSSLDDIPDEAIQERDLYKKLGFGSAFILPLVNNDRFLGVIAFGRIEAGPVLGPELALRLKIVADVFVQALMKIESDKALSESNRKLMEMKEQIESERNYLQEEISNEHNFENIIGQSRPLCTALARLEKVAVTDATVLIQGETGTGKELFARAVHSLSKRSHRPLIKVNCAGLPSNLIEDELFGHERGAFTGAHTSRKGRFELAAGGTIFLDEIGELPIETQGKLLNILQEGEFERLGSARTIRVDVRIIAATNRDLKKEVDTGRLREDLFYRLNKVPIVVPPLRDRLDDIPHLVDWIVKKVGPTMGIKIDKIPVSAIESLQAYSWPGNIRELENVIENAIIYSGGGKLRLPNKLKPGKLKSRKQELLISGRQKSLAEMNHDYIKEILIAKNWKIEGSNGAAETLGLPPSTLRNKINKYGIKQNKHDYLESGTVIEKALPHFSDHANDESPDQARGQATPYDTLDDDPDDGLDDTPHDTPDDDPVFRLIRKLKGGMNRKALQAALGLKDTEHFRKSYIQPALEAGLIEMTIPDKPRSKKQKYRLTEKGQKKLVNRAADSTASVPQTALS
jgi:transcriptional regulator with GAF, ATPase, and Fis domain